MTADPQVLLLAVEDELLALAPGVYGEDAAVRLLSLAQALMTSPPWRRVRDDVRLVARPGTAPTLAFIGRVPQEDRPLLDALGWQVQDSLRRLHPVPYADVEQLCEVLAERLRQRLGPDRLRSARLSAVPRGGLVVAGLLAYALGLSHDQVDLRPTEARDLIVVDDCMLSGARARRWLVDYQGPPVVLAHLHSHPDLRMAAEQDPRVAACIAAADLRDHAPDRQGERYDAWRADWALRSPDDFWTGHPDHVVYPWNEPDTMIWNPVSATAEAAWHVVPPAWCLKNRTLQRPDEIQICASPHVPSEVLWGYLDNDVLVLVNTHRGDCLELSGSGVDFWRELITSGDVAVATETLAATYAVDRSVLLTDLESLAAQLRDGGWWEPGSAA